MYHRLHHVSTGDVESEPAPKARFPRRGVTFGHMTARTRPLLAPGNEVEWTEINREEDEQRRSIARALTPSQRIARGQKLFSQQAVRLLAASIRAGHVPRRALRS